MGLNKSQGTVACWAAPDVLPCLPTVAEPAVPRPRRGLQRSRAQPVQDAGPEALQDQGPEYAGPSSRTRGARARAAA